jgi:hypothetical protein
MKATELDRKALETMVLLIASMSKKSKEPWQWRLENLFKQGYQAGWEARVLEIAE